MLIQAADGVLVHQSPLLRNNSVAVVGRAGVLLVDPGITGDEMACLAGDLADSGHAVVAGFSTHPDWDHALWHAGFGSVPRYGTDRGAAFLRELLADPEWRARLAEGLPPEIAAEVPLELFGLITGVPGDVVPWDGPRVRVVEHQGHAQGHAALVVEESGVLIAGDMLSDVLVPFPDLGADDPIGDYLAGLARLEEVAGEVSVVIPGHGSVGGADEVRARIDLDRAYVHALADGRVPDDPRIGPAATFGQDWLPEVAQWQVRHLAERRDATPG